MKRVNIERLISKLITVKRNEVINALMLSNIKVYGNITNQDLYDLTMNELKKSNADLNTHLGDVIDATFDLSPLTESTSNLSGDPQPYSGSKPFAETKVGGFLSSNSGALISGGFDLLKGIFGDGGGSSTPAATTQTGGGGSDSTILLMMQQQQQQAAAEAERRRLEDEASRRNTWLIVGVVGGLVVIGGIVAIVLTRKN